MLCTQVFAMKHGYNSCSVLPPQGRGDVSKISTLKKEDIVENHECYQIRFCHYWCLGSNPPSYDQSERVSVLYEPSSPQAAKIDGFFSLWGGALIVGGIEIHASFQGVEQNTGLTVNGCSPFRLVCQWQHPQTRELHIFRSDNLWFDPTDLVSQEKIPVRVDEGNLKKYWVDTSFLPKLAG